MIPFGGTSTNEFSSTTPDGLNYCSESCFTQSRRASYKRAKTCDWCKHIRHAVSYVDFHDGATQLQFCSDKCLNQYKMQIFCKETQAHLDLNPYLKDATKTSHDNLITPDLWMRNCRSRSITPPDAYDGDQHQQSNDSSQSAFITVATANRTPTIKVAAVSKFLQSPDEPEEATANVQHDEPKSMNSAIGQKAKNLRKRRANRLSSSGLMPATATTMHTISDSGNLSDGSNNSSNENRVLYPKRMRSTAKNLMGGCSERQRQKQQQLRRNHLSIDITFACIVIGCDQ